MTQKSKVLYEKKLLPTTVGKLCDVIDYPCSLHDLDRNCVIPSITAAENTPIHSGYLYVPADEKESTVRSYVDNGAMGVLTDRYIEGIPCLVTKDKKEAIYRICKWMYSAIDLPCTVVAGSAGKTTLKRMLASVLRTEHNVFCLLDNYNTLYDLIGSLQLIETGAEYLVQEVDECIRRNCFYSSKILSPEIAAITNITDSHIKYYGSTEALIKSFREITAGMDENGVVLINADDPVSARTVFHPNTIRVGIYTEDADCRATKIEISEKGTSFDLHYQGHTVRVKLSIPGEHNVYNAMMAYVIGRRKGIQEKHILAALKRFKSFGIRQTVCRYRGTLIYADCYNANAMSVSYAIKSFCEMQHQGKRIAVIGDIAEISGHEESIYRRIAEAVDHSSLDVLLTCGKQSEMIPQFMTKDILKKHFDSKNGLNNYLKTLKKSGKNAYLFKASRIMALETCIKEVFPMHYLKLMLPNYYHLLKNDFNIRSATQYVRRKIASSKK